MVKARKQTGGRCQLIVNGESKKTKRRRVQGFAMELLGNLTSSGLLCSISSDELTDICERKEESSSGGI